jgi:hypothetical protein
LAHAVIIAVSKLTNDPNYDSYRRGYKILPVVQQLLETTGIDLEGGAGVPGLARFQEHFSEYRIVLYEGLNCDHIMYDGQFDSPRRINLLYDEETKHYHVINSLTGAMVKKYVFKACNKGCDRGVTHTSDHTCSDCMESPPSCRREIESPVMNATDSLGLSMFRQSQTVGRKQESVSARERDTANLADVIATAKITNVTDRSDKPAGK